MGSCFTGCTDNAPCFHAQTCAEAFLEECTNKFRETCVAEKGSWKHFLFFISIATNIVLLVLLVFLRSSCHAEVLSVRKRLALTQQALFADTCQPFVQEEKLSLQRRNTFGSDFEKHTRPSTKKTPFHFRDDEASSSAPETKRISLSSKGKKWSTGADRKRLAAPSWLSPKATIPSPSRHYASAVGSTR